MIPVILSGGTGSRLWPLSRTQFPKQFLSLTSEFSLFQETVRRLSSEQTERPVVVCNQEHRFHVAEQLETLQTEALFQIFEPFGRNTAPAIALTAMHLLAQGKDELMLVLPADHIIRDIDRFRSSLALAQQSANNGNLVLFGVTPTRAETGYGYIRCEQMTQEQQCVKVLGFHEKPNATTAQRFLQDGSYFWNSGMFLFKASTFLEELMAKDPDTYSNCELSYKNSQSSGNELSIDPETFAHCPDQSIDYAVMEKTSKAVVVPLDAQWSDVGCWQSLWEVSDKDSDGNVSIGDTLLTGTEDCYVQSSGRLVSMLGAKNLVVIDTKDALLIADKSKVQDIKGIVKSLNTQGRPETSLHREVRRPWGSYDSVDNGRRFQVKRICVKPGQSLSLQKHHHRAEHWIVVSGTARVTCDDKTFLLSENQSTYIPVGSVHRLSNPGKIMLEIIEVQSGSYLGEDDIVRLEDNYGRTQSASQQTSKPENEADGQVREEATVGR